MWTPNFKNPTIIVIFCFANDSCAQWIKVEIAKNEVTSETWLIDELINWSMQADSECAWWELRHLTSLFAKSEVRSRQNSNIDQYKWMIYFIFMNQTHKIKRDMNRWTWMLHDRNWQSLDGVPFSEFPDDRLKTAWNETSAHQQAIFWPKVLKPSPLDHVSSFVAAWIDQTFEAEVKES